MSRKHIVFLVALLMINLIFIGKVSAKNMEDYDCKYTDARDNIYAFDINLLLVKGEVYTSTSGDKPSGEIKNWGDPFEGTSTNSGSFGNNTCPDYLISYKDPELSYAIASMSDLYNIKSFLTNKYGVSSELGLGSGIIEVYNLKLDSCGQISGETQCNSNKNLSCYWNDDLNYCMSTSTSCFEIKDKPTCTQNPYFSCVWNEDYGYCNTDNLRYVACGNARDIPYQLPQITHFSVNLLKIAVPIILVLVSMITLVKAIISSNEDDMKKAQKSLVRRAIAAVIIFFVVSIVQLVMSIAADESDINSITSCIDCFLTNDCGSVTYYKNNVNGEYQCRNVETKEYIDCKYPED